MNRLYACIAFILLSFSLYADNSAAYVAKGGTPTLKIRAGRHPDFLRIVIEGQGALISKGKVTRRDGSIIVSFPDAGFAVQKDTLPFELRRKKGLLMFSPGKFSRLKTFSLREPDRLVIDVYGTVYKQKRPDPPPKTALRKKKIIKAKKQPQAEKAGKTEARSNTESQTGRPENRTYTASVNKQGEDYGFIPDEYKKVTAILKSGKAYAALKELLSYRPDGTASIAAYHYLYGEAFSMLKNYPDAVKHYRMAYIYAVDRELREHALFKRAEAYRKTGLLHEARADYLVFIREFPSSAYIERAHLKLADTLSEMGKYREAVRHYSKGGTGPEALFGMANALQRLGEVEEARKAYAAALAAYKDYPKRSPETYFLIGENMLMAGETEAAERHLSMIRSGPFKYRADLSLGLIAMQRSDPDEAVQRFKSAARSGDRRIRARALFNLHTAYLRKNKLKEAISALEEIRINYPDSPVYKAAIFGLSELYRKEGRLKDSISLLKELVYGKEPPAEVFTRLEEILLEASKKAENRRAAGEFTELWNEVGQWRLDESREEFLIKIAGRLRYEGRPFLDICSWLIENGSARAAARAALLLADYYIGMGDTEISGDYLEIARQSHGGGDDFFRVRAKIERAAGDPVSALKSITAVREFKDNDLALLGDIIYDLAEKKQRKKLWKAVALYERKLAASQWKAADYVRLADILYENNEKKKALRYYRAAYRKDPSDEWTVYRVAYLSGMHDSKDLYSRIKKGDSLLSRLAGVRLMEIGIMDKINEVY